MSPYLLLLEKIFAHDSDRVIVRGRKPYMDEVVST